MWCTQSRDLHEIFIEKQYCKEKKFCKKSFAKKRFAKNVLQTKKVSQSFKNKFSKNFDLQRKLLSTH